MNRYMVALFLSITAVFVFSPVAAMSLDDPSDYQVVNAIKRRSNLTAGDVDKIKLTWLGPLQNVAAGLAGTYATYKAATGSLSAGQSIESFLQGTKENPAQAGIMKTYLSESVFNLLADKRFWALAGAAGVGIAAYKTLNPRLGYDIVSRVKTFADMCENLDVYSFNYTSNPAYLPGMGSATANSQGVSYDPQWLGVNAAWGASNIAREKGIINLLSQADAAMGLLAQVKNTPEVQNLRSRVGIIKQYITNNYLLINQAAQKERKLRNQNRSIQLAGAQQAAQIDLTRQQASALWYGKISLAATAMSNFVKGSLNTLVYINDNKEKIVGGAIIGSAAVYGSLLWLQSKLLGK